MADMADLVRQTEALEARVEKLSPEWAQVEREFAAARHTYSEADASYQAAVRDSKAAASALQRARSDWESAKARWEFYQQLVILAAAIDASNLDAFRAASGAEHVSSTECSDGQSTRTFRRRLEKQGIDLTGKDVDHIVPRSLGGADHPANYQLLASSVNRSIQDTWTTAKCRGVGLGACAAAMLVSKRCGAFRGPFF